MQTYLSRSPLTFSGSMVWLISAKLNRWLGFSVSWHNTEDAVWWLGHYGQFRGERVEKESTAFPSCPLISCYDRHCRIYGFLGILCSLTYRGQNSLPVCLPVVCCPLQSAWTSSSCMKGSVCRTALLTSMLKTSTAFPAMQPARIVTGRTWTTALLAPSNPLSSTVACALKSALKGLTMKKPLETAKVGSCCFPQNSAEIQMGLVKDYPKRVCMCQLMSLSVSCKRSR